MTEPQTQKARVWSKPRQVESALFEPIERKRGLKSYLAATAIDLYADRRLNQNCDETGIFEIGFGTASTGA